MSKGEYVKEQPMKTEPKPLLTARDWLNAMYVQSAVNVSGVIHSLAEVMPRIRNSCEAEGKIGTDAWNNHPIVRMYADQIAHLTSGISYHEAYKIVEGKINESNAE